MAQPAADVDDIEAELNNSEAYPCLSEWSKSRPSRRNPDRRMASRNPSPNLRVVDPLADGVDEDEVIGRLVRRREPEAMKDPESGPGDSTSRRPASVLSGPCSRYRVSWRRTSPNDMPRGPLRPGRA